MGQILSAGHFWQPATKAMGQRVIWVLQGSVRGVAAAAASMAAAVQVGYVGIVGRCGGESIAGRIAGKRKRGTPLAGRRL